LTLRILKKFHHESFFFSYYWQRINSAVSSFLAKFWNWLPFKIKCLMGFFTLLQNSCLFASGHPNTATISMVKVLEKIPRNKLEKINLL
jgi:hypothetical protein